MSWSRWPEPREQIRAALSAVTLEGPCSYAWLGVPIRAVPSWLARLENTEAPRALLAWTLQGQLYADFYTTGGVPSPPHRRSASAAPSRFSSALSRANRCPDSLEPGWSVVDRGTDTLRLERRGLALRAPRGCFVPDDPTSADDGGLRVPSELRGLAPGFTMLLGPQALPPAPTTRLYWNVSARWAPALVGELTARLTRARLPYRLKLLSHPGAYPRADAAVLWLTDETLSDAWNLIGRVHARVSAGLGPAVPALTRALAPGLGVADEPADGGSFGLHRCGLLVDAILESGRHRGPRGTTPLESALARFREAGVDPDRPHLEAGRRDHFPAALPDPRGRSGGGPTPHGMSLARRIGAFLIQRAVWHRERCNWLQPIPEESAPGRLSRRPLGTGLYEGTAGVALFLGELAAHTGDADAERAARGAISHALHRVARQAPGAPASLYTGPLGAAIAAARLGELTDDRRLRQRARELARDLQALAPGSDSDLDLLTGAAGTVVGLLRLGPMTGIDLGAAAVRWGEHLLGAAKNRYGGLAWPSGVGRAHRLLTGFAHGASGVGYALGLLGEHTGDPRFGDAARAAFRFERRWYDTSAGNWADLRFGASTPIRQGGSWCHGAPGIALARLAAARMAAPAEVVAEAHAALATTRRLLEDSLWAGRGGPGLCHGPAGNAEVLLIGARSLARYRTETETLCRRVVAVAIDSLGRRGEEEPVGLMLGLAGVGYFGLRLARSAVPSLILLA